MNGLLHITTLTFSNALLEIQNTLALLPFFYQIAAESFAFLQKEWFWAMMQAVVVAATLLFISLQFKIQAAGHMVSVLNTIDARWHSDSMLRARHIVCSRWLDDEYRFDAVARHIANFIEELEMYVETNAIPENVMWDMESRRIEAYYRMFEADIVAHREETKEALLYTGFENLYERMQRVGKKKRRTPARIANIPVSPPIDEFPVSPPIDERLMWFAEKEVSLTEMLLSLQSNQTGYGINVDTSP